ncbi:hypothetical protein GX51_04283 [Blastomyces parvus]|uniref:RZ-type domain-containing protein n=1 Tax=Blastomyces parvus TaxID=2060905 RepID=A0A2B7X224_9EURO|nr:hypothetical protein GX51_04283 [Blastomyces parvus]
MGVNVRHALNHAKFVAAIQNAANLATNPALLALRENASQAAHMRSARCHARRHVIGHRAISGARRRPSLCGEVCPASIYCQQCGSEDIKSVCVDFLEMKEYREIDLDDEPCIFPDCGHFLTVSSMDGQVNIASHYELDENGLPVKIRGASEPFSMDASGISVCATCRGSLRTISRYGRIVRRAMLDEATKKFIKWSQAKYIALADRLLAEQKKLEEAPAVKLPQPASREKIISRPGSRLRQLQTLQKVAGTDRYGSTIKVWHMISAYAGQVRREEQPFQRVADLVKHANLRHKTEKQFQYDKAIIQVKGHLLAMALLLKCDIIVLSDFINWCKAAEPIQTEVKIDLSAHLLDSANLIELARNTMHPKEEVQGHVFAAYLYGFSRFFNSSAPSQTSSTDSATDTSNRLRETGLNHLAQAREILEKYPSAAVLKDEIDAAESMLNGSVYRQVTAEELRAVYRAMSGEFRGTGHWYTCQNGHPFTIGECGMPMEQARCPECVAPIGGQNHQAVEGVRHATEIEEVAGEVNRFTL